MKFSKKLFHPAWIEVNLQQFKHNINSIRNQLGNTQFCLPIKANAYGHGLVPVGLAAEQANVDCLAVSCLQEGAQLREAGIRKPILIMGAIQENDIPDLLRYQLEITIASLYKARLIAEQCANMGRTCRVHLEVDTGMHRTGVRPATAVELLNYVNQQPCFELAGVYSHLATADKPGDKDAEQQIKIFQSFLSTYIDPNKKITRHLANSGGVCYYPHAYMDMVRPGILTFGYFLQNLPLLADVKPFFSVKAKISYFKVVGKGEGIGYDYSYRTKAETRIVTVPIGYGDGYRRALSNKGSVLIRGQRYPIVGKICMDQLMVDIGQNEAYVGEEVTLIGKQGDEEITLNEIASLCETIPYEILCGFNDRLPRYYSEE